MEKMIIGINFPKFIFKSFIFLFKKMNHKLSAAGIWGNGNISEK